MTLGLKVIVILFLSLLTGTFIGSLHLGVLGMVLAALSGYLIATVILNIGD